MLQRRVSHDSPTTSRASRNPGRISSAPGSCHPGVFDHLGNFSPGDKGTHPRVRRPCFLTGSCVGGIEEVLGVFPPLSLGRGEHRP